MADANPAEPDHETERANSPASTGSAGSAAGAGAGAGAAAAGASPAAVTSDTSAKQDLLAQATAKKTLGNKMFQGAPSNRGRLAVLHAASLAASPSHAHTRSQRTISKGQSLRTQQGSNCTPQRCCTVRPSCLCGRTHTADPRVLALSESRVRAVEGGGLRFGDC